MRDPQALVDALKLELQADDREFSREPRRRVVRELAQVVTVQSALVDVPSALERLAQRPVSFRYRAALRLAERLARPGSGGDLTCAE
ncbi:MAG TPA: hypothetical protein P5568_14430 [Acidobacteriota bacterium]|nr:hypothetical protein [Acidobacteriota bacterium]HRV09652.1 hypothetical protein [Acidobacteriota bacterium]